MSLDLNTLEELRPCRPARRRADGPLYARPFATAPAVKPPFAGTDPRRQKAMLLGALVRVRKSLRDLGAIVPKLRELGARHVAYGAQPEHYPSCARC